MTETALLGLPYIAEADAQPWIPHNAALDTIDGVIGHQVGALGASLSLRVTERTLTGLSGPDVTAAALIPDRAVVLGVASWVPADGPAITGATGFKVGLTAGADEFGAALGIAAGASNRGVVAPFPVYAATDVIVTAEGSDFTGGDLRLAALYILPEVTP